MMSETKLLFLPHKFSFKFCGMNVNELRCNLWETLPDSTNLLDEMSQISSKNIHLYWDHHRIFGNWKQIFFKHMHFAFYSKI